jgi:hypothetical protein
MSRRLEARCAVRAAAERSIEKGRRCVSPRRFVFGPRCYAAPLRAKLRAVRSGRKRGETSGGDRHSADRRNGRSLRCSQRVAAAEPRVIGIGAFAIHEQLCNSFLQELSIPRGRDSKCGSASRTWHRPEPSCRQEARPTPILIRSTPYQVPQLRSVPHSHVVYPC